jgi:hypothetical protein
MAERSYYQISGSLSSGYDFYTSDDTTKFAAVVLSGSADVSAGVIVIRSASAELSAQSDSSSSAILILNASSSLSGTVTLAPIGTTILISASIVLFQSLNITAKTVRFSSVSGIDSQVIRTVMMLDGKPLTNQTRSLQVSAIPIFVENRNWNGNSSRYYKNPNRADKKSFSISWSFIPNSKDYTVDLNHARDYIRKISNDSDMHVFSIVNQDESGVTPYTETVYNVFVKDFSESLIRRDLVDNMYYWSCSVTLEEV